MIKVHIYSAHPSHNAQYGGASKRDVTEFCHSVSWSFSLNSPYETINLSMAFPLASYRNREVIPVLSDTAGDTPDTGFWITIVQANPDRSDGPLLAWGVTDSVNLDIDTDETAGTLMCSAEVSASSWVHYVNRHRFTLTTWKAEDQAGFQLAELIRQKGGGTITANNALLAGQRLLAAVEQVDSILEKNNTDFLQFSTAPDTITDEKRWFSQNLPELGDAETKARIISFIDSFMITKEEMGVIVAGLRKSIEAFGDDLSEDRSCVPLKTIISEFWDRIKLPQSMGGGNFSQKMTVLEGNTTEYVDKVGPELGLELSRMGMAASVLTGFNPNTLFLPDGGTWGWLKSAFMFDPNYMELYPTLIPVDIDGKSNTQTRLKSPANLKEDVFEEKQRGLAFSPKYAGRKTTVQMQPALVYRLRPYHPTLQWKGSSFIAPNGKPLKPFTLQGKSKLFPEKALPESIHKIQATRLSRISFSVSENTKVNMTAVKQPVDGIKFGYGFDNLRKPTFRVDRLLGYGLSYQELAWPQFSKNQKIYEALSEYLVSMASHGSMGEGSINIDYSPYIKAGHWFTLVGGTDDPLDGFTGYVESATHSVQATGQGGMIMRTSIRFSAGTYSMFTDITASNYGPGNI